MPIMTFVSNLSYVAVVILGGYLAVQGTISVGDILAFIQYVRSFTQPIMQVANIANVLQSRRRQPNAFSTSWMQKRNPLILLMLSSHRR